MNFEPAFNRVVHLILIGSAILAFLGFLGVQFVQFIEHSKASIAERAFVSLPAAASLMALALARWRFPRLVAAGVLWFFSLPLLVFFYLPAAILQTISIFPRATRRNGTSSGRTGGGTAQ